jgi:hypothetical protein
MADTPGVAQTVMTDIKKKLFELTLNLQTHQQTVLLAGDASPEQSGHSRRST